MIKQRGMTLIEIVIFILVISITATGAFLGFNTVLLKSDSPAKLLQASQLANARMSIILLQGLGKIYSDPCSSGAPPAACTALAAYATSQGFTVNTSYSVSGDIVTATVNVTGVGGATMSMRFLQ